MSVMPIAVIQTGFTFCKRSFKISTEWKNEFYTYFNISNDNILYRCGKDQNKIMLIIYACLGLSFITINNSVLCYAFVK